MWPRPRARAAPAARPHGVDGAEPVDPGELLDQLGRHLVERQVMGDAGVRDHHVELAELIHGVLDRGRVANVACKCHVSISRKSGGQLSSGSAERATSPSVHPRAAKAWAIEAPIPREAPVTRTRVPGVSSIGAPSYL